MCVNCGEIFTQAGYKVVAEPMNEVPTVVVETKEPVVTQMETPHVCLHHVASNCITYMTCIAYIK